MRQQLNENPRVQIIVLAVVGVIAAFLLFNTVLKGDPAVPPPTDPAATAPADSGTPPAAGTDAAAATPPASTDPATAPVDPAVPPADAGATTPVTPPAGGGDPGAADGLLPTKGLPKDVLVAYAKNKAIVLLVVDPKGLSDQRLESFMDAIRTSDKTGYFQVDVKDIADYSRITSGVSVNRVPALVVVRPRDLNEGEPTASVSYGFRSPKSAAQAVKDMLYEGKPATSYP